MCAQLWPNDVRHTCHEDFPRPPLETVPRSLRVHASVGASGNEREGSCSAVYRQRSLLVDHGTSFRDRYFDKKACAMDRSSWISVAFNGEQAAERKSEKPEGTSLELRLPDRGKVVVQESNPFSGATRHQYQTRHSGASVDRVPGYRSLQEVQQRRQWRSLCGVTSPKTTVAVVWQPTTTSLSRASKQTGNSRQTSRGAAGWTAV